MVKGESILGKDVIFTIVLTQSLIFLFGLGLAYFKIRRDLSAAIEKEV